ncbi:MAG: ribonuclease E inhibitor RraB [Desulfobacteraceae bacterium]|nr:MAG: ribonuclease E inhibitor RraB [Desulfobacteraceae bacterium]
MDWPNDVDGEVLSGLEADHFDFNKEYQVDFNVDFEEWPPAEEAVRLLKSKYANIETVDPEEGEPEEDGCNGYLSFQIKSRVTYEFVTQIQKETTEAMRPFGGWCESWGVMEG